MGIVIGFGTVAKLGTACAISASWGANPGTQRLYCLDGTFKPKITISKPTKTANLTIYSSTDGPEVTVTASTACEAFSAAGDVSVTITPAACGTGSGGGFSAQGMYVTSYSYTREDTTIPGQESWSLNQWIKGPATDDKLPSHIIRGPAEGQATADAGVTWDTAVTTVSASSGNISAGGMGRSDDLSIGVASKVGKGKYSGTSTGSASISIPLTPLWISTT